MRACWSRLLLIFSLSGPGALHASLPLKTETGAGLSTGLHSLLLAVLLCALVGLVLWCLRRNRRGTYHDGDGAKLVRSRRLSQKTVLLEVEWEGRKYLLAESAGAISLIDSSALRQDDAAGLKSTGAQS